MNPRVEKMLQLPLYQRLTMLVVLLLVIIGLYTWFFEGRLCRRRRLWRGTRIPRRRRGRPHRHEAAQRRLAGRCAGLQPDHLLRGQASLRRLHIGQVRVPGAQASAVAITAGAQAGAGTTGATAGASAGKKDATTTGQYNEGIAAFTIVKGRLMYEAALSGAKFSYEPIKK